MNRRFVLPSLSTEELLELQRLLRAQSAPVGLHRRCNLIWQLAAGYSIAEAGEIVELHYTNAHKWVKRFATSGIAGLESLSRPGRPRLYAKDPTTLVIQVATSRPKDLGLGFTTWSLVKLQDHLRERTSLKAISRETVRRILVDHGLRFLTGQTWCKNKDPDFEVQETLS